MESKDNGHIASKIPIIFSPLSSYQIQIFLEKHHAKDRESKAVFLICENSSCPGLANVAYYSQERDMILSQKLGLTKEGWKLGPNPPQAPKITESLEIKERYKQDKKKFEEDMQTFINTSKTLFDQEVNPELIKTLGIELQKHDFNLDGLIRPNEAQATQEKHFTHYISSLFFSGDNLNPTLPESALW